MAYNRLTIEGYGQLELNNVAFPRDGRVEAQCKLNATDFASKVAENGMLLAVDNVAREIKLPTNASLPIAINYSAEHMYDQYHRALKDFKLTKDDVYPRLGYLSVGDKFTTNCVGYDTSDYATEAALLTALEPAALASSPVYGGYSADGSIAIVDTKPSDGPVLRVIAKTTMPDGTIGIKFQVYGV